MTDPNPYAAPSSEAATPPTEQSPGLRLASRWRRLVAVLIDGVVLTVASFLAALLVPRATPFLLDEEPPRVLIPSADQLLVSSATWLASSLLIIVLFSYGIVARGQTPGKMVMDIYIARSDGSRVGWTRGLLIRQVAWSAIGIFPLLGLPLALIDALMIFGDERRCLHDRIADTIVLEDV
ncbi:MAG: RDD family protein [Acidobacteriota bacterium]